MSTDLDIRVATEVMCWPSLDECPEYHGPNVVLRGTCYVTECVRLREWSPSANIRDAFDVVDELEQGGWCFKLEQCGVRPSTVRWRGVFRKGIREYEAISATRAEAICLAALEAVKATKATKDVE
jgi:hypothetical protein